MSFLEALERGTNQNARTENNAVTNASSLDPVLDFFGLAGAMRGNLRDARKLFSRAFSVDPQTAVRTLFYLRDIRGGQGERDLFRELYKVFQILDRDNANRLLSFIPEYGRWDDLVAVADTEHLIAIVRRQLKADRAALYQDQPVSLMAKWLPSENASSKENRVLARALAAGLGLSNRDYRKVLVDLRLHIKLLEHKMSTGAWSEIDYGKIPSQAGRKHNKAFRRHDENRYQNFLDSAIRGETKINTGTLFTYEVFDLLRQGGEQTAEAMWANLPDYTNGDNALVIADTSGSMFADDAIKVSVSLALYFAEHNTGPFHNYFMAFSDQSQLVHVRGNSLSQRLNNIETTEWGYNTNIERAFFTILDAAVKAGAEATDIPKVVYIISDMEFDNCTTGTNFERAEQMFTRAGFTLPHLVFWNVRARQIQTPVTKYDNHVTLISGLSQSAFRYAVEGKTPVELMLSVINSERYAPITV